MTLVFWSHDANPNSSEIPRGPAKVSVAKPPAWTASLAACQLFVLLPSAPQLPSFPSALQLPSLGSDLGPSLIPTLPRPVSSFKISFKVENTVPKP